MAVALVTGASGGLGRTIALALAGHGYDVAIHYRGDDLGAAQTADAIHALGRHTQLVHADFDVRGPTALDALAGGLVDDVEDTLGPVRALVLNAHPQTLTPWRDLDTAAWDAMIAGGLRPSAALLRAASERMRVRGTSGVIVTIGSVEGLRAARGHTAYAVAKAALHHLTAAAASELGELGIRVVGVAPGLIAREGLDQNWPEGLARWRAATPLRRPVTAQEVAATVAFLASDAASGITGVTIPVDAGWSAAPGW